MTGTIKRENLNVFRDVVNASPRHSIVNLLGSMCILFGLFSQAYSQSDPTNLAASGNAAGTLTTLTWTADGAPSAGTLVVYRLLDADFSGWSPAGDYSAQSQNVELDGATGVYFVYYGALETVDHTTTPSTTYYYQAYSYKSNGTYSSPGAPLTDISLPVELGLWEGTSENGNVKLIWITESEIENQGFIIERASTSLPLRPSTEFILSEAEGLGMTVQGTTGQASSAIDWEEIASFITHPELLGQGSTTRQTVYEYIDADVLVGETYAYRLADVDYVSTITYHDVISVTVRDADETQQPAGVTLMDAYPNPFNPSTSLRFEIPENVYVSLIVYDLRGNEIANLVQDQKTVGWHTILWNALDNQGKSLPTGVYLARIQAGTYSQTVKLSHLK